MATKKITPAVYVVLDTNALFTELEDKLISLEISAFIKGDARTSGVEISWHLPGIVQAERRAQMADRAQKLLVPLSKLERLLGHNLAITEDVVNERVDSAIARQMHDHSLLPLELDQSVVDWQRVILNAAAKTPPFSAAGEKGFKDAVVLECYLQLAESLPKSPSTCRVILLTGDAVLQQAAKTRISEKGWKSTSVASNLDELRALLNAMAAHIPDDVLAEIIPQARLLFYNNNSPDSLYEKSGVEKILADTSGIHAFAGKVAKIDIVENILNPPVFLSKQGQKLIFSTSIERRFSVSSGEDFSKMLRILQNTAERVNKGRLSHHLFEESFIEKDDEEARISEFRSSVKRQLEKLGRQITEVIWSVTLTKTGRLSAPKIVNVDVKGPQWDLSIDDL